MIELIKLTKKFGNFAAINEVTLRIEEGEVFGLLGPNGAGKSTLVSMLSTVVKPTSGETRINNKPLLESESEVKSIIGIVPEMVEYIHSLYKEVNIRIKSFGHAGDGNLHAYVLKDDLSNEEWEKRMTAAMDKIYEKAIILKGQVSGEHGIGYAKKSYLKEAMDPATVEIMRGIKKAFDPKNILNPRKVCQ
jgi:FAD/FMN-containing dehydrogenase